jgi:hypothetical protein
MLFKKNGAKVSQERLVKSRYNKDKRKRMSKKEDRKMTIKFNYQELNGAPVIQGKFLIRIK